MGSTISSYSKHSSLLGRTPLRVLITLVLVGSFGLLLVNSSLLSSPLPGSPSPHSSRPPFSDKYATWSRSDRKETHPRPPDAPRDAQGRCTFRDPLGHLPFAVTSSSRHEGELGEASPIDRRRIQEGGLISVDESDVGTSQHPMLGLIREGERKFEAKVRSQSRTVDEARAEYERRNDGQSPPIGFDNWFRFAQEKDALFPDEYDGIMRLLRPWLRLSPTERLRRLSEAEHRRPGQEGLNETRGKQNLVRLISDGMGGLGWEPLLSPSPDRPAYPPPSRERASGSQYPAYVPTHSMAPNKRTKAILGLLNPIRHLLPRFSIVMNCADQPMVLLPSHQKAQLEPVSGRDFAPPPFQDGSDQPVLWDDVCKGVPTSNISDAHDGFTFVQDVSKANDPCVHPSIRKHHGLFLDKSEAGFKHVAHSRLLPIWSQCSTPHHSDLLLPPIGIDGRFPKPGKKDVAWSFKRPQIFWRGSVTGMTNVRSNDPALPPPWLASHRARLHLLANDLAPAVSEAVLAVSSTGQMMVKSAWKATVGAWMDVKVASTIFWQWFSWWPELGQQCSWRDGSCTEMKSYLNFALKAPEDEVDLYKFALDVDGNAWSARFFRLLASRSLVIKSTIFTEWNTENHPDWFGYVPSHWSYKDLHSILAFFKGPPDSSTNRYADYVAYDEIARIMAENGKCFEERAWRIEDMQVYMLRALIEYARLFGEEAGEGGSD